MNKEATEAEILRRTDQLRGALLNAVSHDLRTPLATIMASAGSLQQRDVQWTDAEADGFAQAIEEEAEHLNASSAICSICRGSRLVVSAQTRAGTISVR